MANPPITIGPFTNVPAPGSPIRSDWTQQITTYAVDIEARTAYVVAGVAGPEVPMFGGGSAASIATVTIPSAGNYLALGQVEIVNRGTGIGQVTINMRINGGVVGMAARAWLNQPSELITVPLFGLVNLAAGSRVVDIIGTLQSGTGMSVAGRQISLLRIK